MSVVLLLAVALPLLAAALAAGPGRTDARLAGRAGLAGATAGLALVVAVAVAVVADGPVDAVLTQDDGSAVAGLTAGRLAVLLLPLVFGVSVVVQGFARRYLHGDPRAPRFFAGASLLTAATAATVTAATLSTFAVAWILAGASLVFLLGHEPHLASARTGVRRTRLAFALGDAALLGAVAVAIVAWGDLDLRTLGADAPDLVGDGAALLAFAVLLVGAALARSAQFPAPSWLPSTLAAPTPISALLHAGVVNGGGILLVRFAPLFGASATATSLAFAAGAATTVIGGAAMIARPDVKGQLAQSTTAQMGFMIMTCGIGAFAAAILHLVAHGMYKATLFLGSGGAVAGLRHRHIVAAGAPFTGPARAGALAVAVLVPAAMVVGARLLVGGGSGIDADENILLVFAWATAARLAWGGLRRRPGAGALLAGAALLAAGVLGYVALIHGLLTFLDPALAGAGTATVPVWLLLPVAAGLGGLALLVRSRRTLALTPRLYAAALCAGQQRHVIPPAAATAPALAPDPEPAT